jgi:hypothetical protein
MSDSLPENEFSGIIRVLKLTSGEEVIGLVSEASPEKYSIKLPARLDTFYSRDENGELLEYVKLTNYLSNIKGFEINLPRDVVIYIGSPNIDLEKMYETYIIAMQQDPKVVITSGEIDQQSSENGLQLLNELFNNEDFVNFVNDLIENFEGAEIVIDDDEGEEEEEPEKPVIEPAKEEAPKPSKPKKRRTMNPEAKKLPYNPEANPNSAEGWSDNPNDYL